MNDLEMSSWREKQPNKEWVFLQPGRQEPPSVALSLRWEAGSLKNLPVHGQHHRAAGWPPLVILFILERYLIFQSSCSWNSVTWVLTWCLCPAPGWCLSWSRHEGHGGHGGGWQELLQDPLHLLQYVVSHLCRSRMLKLHMAPGPQLTQPWSRRSTEENAGFASIQSRKILVACQLSFF